MSTNLYVASAAVASSIPLLWWSVSSGRVSGQSAGDHLKPFSSGPVDLRQLDLARPAQERVVSPLMAGLADRARRITPAGVVDSLERRIDLAGMGGSWSVDRVLGIKALGVLVGASLGFLRFAGDPSTSAVVLAVMLVAIGYLAPDLVIGSRSSSRQEEIKKSLPDMLDQLSISVEAGLGFEPALARVARGGEGPLNDELARTLQDIQLGVPRGRAFESLVARTDVPDLRHFVTAFLQAERNGIPVAHVLRVQSGEMRQKRRTYAEERAQKLPVKMIFPLVTCILPALFLVLLTPAGIRAVELFQF
jgi:tight adherence protein C